MSSSPESGTVALTGCALDLATGHGLRDGTPIALTTRELDLMRFFVANAGRVVPRDELLSRVWGYGDVVVSRACDNTVRRLRAKVERDAAHPLHLFTVHGTGYRFEPLEGMPAPVTPVPIERPLTALGPTRIDLGRRRVHRPDGELELSEPEAVLLDVLVRAEGRVVDRAALIRAAWGHRPAGGGRVLDNTMSKLRAKIEPSAEARFLITVRGTGYRLEIPPDRTTDPDLVGRDAWVAAALDAMTTERWVLLVGPAGVGKSRLARRLSALRDVTVTVDCSSAWSAAQAAAALATAMGIEVGGADPVAKVGQVLARRTGTHTRTLVVLDNLEHAATEFAGLIHVLGEAAPDVRWLGTSRIRLGVAGERVIEVEPLDLSAAATLFVRRAAAAAPGTAPLAAGLPEVRQLVERLDRIPLAIELAAPRLRVLSIGDLLARLDVDLLVHPTATDRRHRSLRAAIEASLDALPLPAIDALRQISLFGTGLFVEDAEGLFGADAIDLLQLLRDHSLLYRVPDETGLRFATWHAVRELLEAESDPDAVRKHCTWLGRRGSYAYRSDNGRLSAAAAARQAAQAADNVSAARRALALGDGALAAACATAATWTCMSRGPFGAGLDLLDEVLSASMPPTARALLLIDRATLRLNTSRFPEAVADLAEVLPLAVEHRLGWIESSAAAHMSWVALHHQIDRVAGRAWLVRAADVAVRDGTPIAGRYLAELALADGDIPLAAKWYAEAIAVARNPLSRGVLLHGLAMTSYRLGRYVEARTQLEEAWTLHAEHGRTSGQRSILNDLAELAYEGGDGAAQERWTSIALQLGESSPNPYYDAVARATRARGRLWSGRTDAAAADLAAAEALTVGAGPYFRAPIAEVRAQWCWVTGDIDGTVLAAGHAATAYTANDDPGAIAYTERHLARARLAAGDRAGARTHAERSWAGLQSGDKPFAAAVAACTVAEIVPSDADVWLDRARAAHTGAVAGADNELGWALDRIGGPSR